MFANYTKPPWGTNGDDAWLLSSSKSANDAWLAWSLETLQQALEQIANDADDA